MEFITCHEIPLELPFYMRWHPKKTLWPNPDHQFDAHDLGNQVRHPWHPAGSAHLTLGPDMVMGWLGNPRSGGLVHQWIGGKIYRKPWFFPSTCRVFLCSLKPIRWWSHPAVHLRDLCHGFPGTSHACSQEQHTQEMGTLYLVGAKWQPPEKCWPSGSLTAENHHVWSANHLGFIRKITRIWSVSHVCCWSRLLRSRMEWSCRQGAPCELVVGSPESSEAMGPDLGWSSKSQRKRPSEGKMIKPLDVVYIPRSSHKGNKAKRMVG